VFPAFLLVKNMNMEKKDIVLASASPRRLSLLEQIKFYPDIVAPSDIDESLLKDEPATDYARRMAVQKAELAEKTYSGNIIIAADTVVACGRRILAKPENEAEARKFLELLSGRSHRVLGGVCVVDANGKKSVRVVTTKVAFKHLSAEEINTYILSKEWEGKAGGYAIQGLAGTFVKQIIGSYSNVVGLPLFETNALLHGMGARPKL